MQIQKYLESGRVFLHCASINNHSRFEIKGSGCDQNVIEVQTFIYQSSPNNFKFRNYNHFIAIIYISKGSKVFGQSTDKPFNGQVYPFPCYFKRNDAYKRAGVDFRC